MSHTVHPYSHRLGILRDWKSRWFGRKGQYQDFLKSDVLLREFLEKHLRAHHVSSIEIERNEKAFRIIIETSRPGMIIGRSGEGAEKLKETIAAYARRKKLNTGEELKLDIREVRSPESNAAIVGKMIAEGLEKRMPFRRVMKQTVEKVMANRDVKGVRAEIAGRLGGADIARTEKHMKGQVPLQTLRADIDFAREEALLPYGKIGIKIWIYKGEVFEKDIHKTN
jgi:small subunit ribosomal protein S3